MLRHRRFHHLRSLESLVLEGKIATHGSGELITSRIKMGPSCVSALQRATQMLAPNHAETKGLMAASTAWATTPMKIALIMSRKLAKKGRKEVGVSQTNDPKLPRWSWRRLLLVRHLIPTLTSHHWSL